MDFKYTEYVYHSSFVPFVSIVSNPIYLLSFCSMVHAVFYNCKSSSYNKIMVD